METSWKLEEGHLEIADAWKELDRIQAEWSGVKPPCNQLLRSGQVLVEVWDVLGT